MQFIVISHQLWEIVLAFSLGMISGLCYDLVRFLRSLFTFKQVRFAITCITDVLFSIFVGCEYCVFLYFASNGRFRLFTAVAFIIGYSVYLLFPSKLISPLLLFVADKIKSLFGLILFPFESFLKLMKSAALQNAKRIKRNKYIKITEYEREQLYLKVKIWDR